MWSAYTDAERLAALDKLKAMGAEWVRLDLSWAMLQPTSGSSFDLRWGVPFADRVIDMAHERGLKVMVMFWMTPDWANGGAGSRVGPSDPRAYAEAIEWASQRWAGKVQAWEVWNEPNLDSFWRGADPGKYVDLLCPAYQAVGRGNPAAKVVFGGVVHNDDAWIREAYAEGAKGCFDVMATHPYVGPSDAAPTSGSGEEIWHFSHLAAVRRVMLNHNDAKPIWATEFGWSTHKNYGGEASWDRGVTGEQQAQYTVEALRLLASSFPYVTTAFIYNERGKETGDAHQDGFGILRSDLRPKRVYWAVKRYLL
jgi:beta-xylosidase